MSRVILSVIFSHDFVTFSHCDTDVCAAACTFRLARMPCNVTCISKHVLAPAVVLGGYTW